MSRGRTRFRPGDAFLLCSDGLTGVVTPEEIGPVVSALPPDEAARLLVNLANLRGGPDNITVLIVHVAGEGGTFQKKAKKSPLHRAFKAWNRKVPWPFTALGIGCLFAAISLAMQFNEVPGRPSHSASRPSPFSRASAALSCTCGRNPRSRCCPTMPPVNFTSTRSIPAP